MRSRIKAWISRYLVDTSVEVQKLRELAADQVNSLNAITAEMKDLNDDREKKIADLNDTNLYWRCTDCGDSKRAKP